MNNLSDPPNPEIAIAFQGEPGAYSHLACLEARPNLIPVPCKTFEDAFAAVEEGRCKWGFIPVENSVAGRVADVHHILPNAQVSVVGEHFFRVNHHLLAAPGASLETIKVVRSHVHALGQCRNFLREHGYQALVTGDTAGAAAEIAALKDPTQAAISSELAGKIHGLVSLAAGIEDAEHNTTRFLILTPKPDWPARGSVPCITTFLFRVRNVPAALFKAMGGFATNSVNMTKLESYQVGGAFSATQFYADVEGHPDDENLKLALEELQFFSHEVRIVGVYPASPFRMANKA